MRPGPRRRGRRFFPPVAVLGPDEVEQTFPLSLVGPQTDYGSFSFEGEVRLTPAIVPRPTPYLFVIKEWEGGPEPASKSTRWIASAATFAEEMRSQRLVIGLDKFGTARIYRDQVRRMWEKRVGKTHAGLLA